jgi:phosphoglycerate dehydrogenase-like enzyme
VLVHDPYLTDAAAAALGIEKVTFEDLVEQSDILHTLTGLTEANKGKLDSAMLARMKTGATIINAGRAPLVEKNALLEALQSRRISAILDVHYREPVPPDDPFLGLPNVIMTPHCAGRPGRDRYVPLVLHEFDRFFKGQPLQHEISRERAMNMTDATLVRG